MSLPALALLHAATGALRDVAPDWMRVEMAPREPLKLVEGGLGDGKHVLVAIYTGDQVHAVRARRWFESSRVVELAVQVLLPPVVEASVNGVSTRFETHRAGADFVFATVHRLLERAFQVPGEPGSWTELYKALVIGHPEPLEAMPFIAATSKLEVPAIDYSLPCELIPSPPIGGKRADFWAALVTRMRADARMKGSAPYLEALLGGDPLPPWDVELLRAGLSREGGLAIGLGTVADAGAQPPASELTIGTPRGALVVTADGDAP